jgi:hypothetical protein
MKTIENILQRTEAWTRFKRAMLFYFVPLMVAALVPIAVTLLAQPLGIWFLGGLGGALASAAFLRLQQVEQLEKVAFGSTLFFSVINLPIARQVGGDEGFIFKFDDEFLALSLGFLAALFVWDLVASRHQKAGVKNSH